MKKGSFLVGLLLNAIAFLIVSSLYKGLEITTGFWGALVTAFIWGIMNALLRPILLVLTLPVNVLTLGVFTLVINGIVLLVTASLYDGLKVYGLGAGVIAAILLSLVNVILSALFVKDNEKHRH